MFFSIDLGLKLENGEEDHNKTSMNWKNVIIGGFLALLLIKPMFQLSVFSGILYILTLAYIIIFKLELIEEYPGYSVVLFGILAVRWGISGVLKEGWTNTLKGNILTGIIFLIVWAMIYLKTVELQKH